MLFVVTIIVVIAGWLDLPRWWAIPLAILMFIGLYRAEPYRAQKVAMACFFLMPIFAALLMMFGGWLHRLI
ncbi:MAG: hypothetical protein M3R41_08430 [Pseudomonadota bacterium]|nr:hypothetical protein [Pseudomonadota bacterium]